MKEYDEKNNSHWYPLIATMLYTGIRVGEMSGLQWGDINISEDGKSGTMQIIHNHVLYYNRELKQTIHSMHEPKTEAGKRAFTLAKLSKTVRMQYLTVFRLYCISNFTPARYEDAAAKPAEIEK